MPPEGPSGGRSLLSHIFIWRRSDEETNVQPVSRPDPVPGPAARDSVGGRRNGTQYWTCRLHDKSPDKCQITQIPESEFERAFLRLYYKLRHHGMPVLSQLLTDLQTAQNRKLLWSLDIVELNKQIADIVRQERLLAELKQQGLVDPDIYITRSNTLAEQLRTAKLEKERFLESEEDQTIRQTQVLLEILETGPEFLEAFDEELFSELVAKIIVENNECLRFRLINGLELTETIERTVR